MPALAWAQRQPTDLDCTYVATASGLPFRRGRSIPGFLRDTLAIRHARIASWHVLPAVSGHDAAHTHPDALAADIRAFFTSLPQRTFTSLPQRTFTSLPQRTFTSLPQRTRP